MENETSVNKISASDNITSVNFNITSYKFRPDIWINDIIFTIIGMFLSLYFVVALLYHQTKSENSRRKSFFHLSWEKKYRVLSRYTCILIVFVSLLRNLNEIGILTMDGVAFLSTEVKRSTVEAEIACNTLTRLDTFLLAISNGLVYLFLWLRQSIFYIQPHLKALNKKCVRVFSAGILFVYLAFGIALFVVYLITFQYEINESGFCQSESNIGSDGWSNTALILVFTVVSILMQIVLLYLFVNPSLKRRLWRDSQQIERSSRLMRRVRKAIVLASICIGTDIFASIANYVLFEEHTNRVLFPYSVNLVINCLVAIACFDWWKQILWPCKTKSRADTSEQSQAISFSTRSIPLT